MVNLGVMLAYVVLSLLLYDKNDEIPGLRSMLTTTIFLVLHVLVNLIAAIVYFVKSDQERGQAFGLSTLIIAIIGFSACTGIMNM